MTQTSLNFPKLQSLLMARAQSGRGNVKKRKKEKEKKQCVSQQSIVPLLLTGLMLLSEPHCETGFAG